MTDESKPQDSQQSGPADPWAEVGQQFRKLGDSLAAAFGATWQSDEARQYMHKMQSSLNDVASQLNEAVKSATDSEQGKKMQAEFEKAAKTAQSQGEEMVQQVRPHLLEAFRSIRQEIDRAISQIEKTPPAASDESAEQK
ncbi:MAG: hypothetical protein FOGNACKC_02679 [Anaerolineae bacterium]|nr:hypothetical protein [Anaerolineae bacterium]